MATAARRKHPVVPDRLDLRDRPYQPAVAAPPRPSLDSTKGFGLPVLDQKETSACTGFALAGVVNFLLMRADRTREAPVSPYMLYSMARRYDEFPGWKEDSGSSLRGAMKGWYKHGVCAGPMWEALDMPDPNPDPAKDWWPDAARRPLGAYYRVDARSVADMHVALNEAGVLYASAICHAGWDVTPAPPDRTKGSTRGKAQPAARRRPDGRWVIPPRKASPDDGGHAFVIVGYDRQGFLIQNSWGRDWGHEGYAVLTYDDWLDNAMDCWVAQLGVVTEQHQQVAKAPTLRVSAGAVTLSSESVLRNREISPFVIDMENNGVLSRRGDFRTQKSDVRALLTTHLDLARKNWSIGNGPMDVAIYAHGGLTGESTAADTAAKWIPALYDAHVFPIFFMWETDLLSTLKNRLADLIKGEPRPTGALRDRFQRWWDQRVESTLAEPGSVIWGEMKQNAEAISSDRLAQGADEQSGGRLLWDVSQELNALDPARVRLHLIGHSAGAIVHSHVVDRIVKAGWRFASVTFMAPAVRVDTFRELVVPHLTSGAVERYNQFHLTDDHELRDETCRPVLLYGRSLLYLVSNSFEHGEPTPILGMQKYFDRDLGTLLPQRIRAFPSPSSVSAATTHGGFDDDQRTRTAVINLIRKGAP